MNEQIVQILQFSHRTSFAVRDPVTCATPDPMRVVTTIARRVVIEACALDAQLRGLDGGPMSRDIETLAEVALAMVLGVVIGLEREGANKPVGVRTHMLVAGAAAFLVALAYSLVGRL